MRPAPKLLAAVMLLIAPLLGTAVGPGSTMDVAASPAPQAGAAASFSDGRCTAGDTTSVTVVIDFQQLGGGTIVRCAHGLSAGARGSAALAAAGIDYTGSARWGSSFVCRINARPGPTEALPLPSGAYRELCKDTPPDRAYWSYWQADEGGRWQYSQLGILSQKTRLGGFEGWSFSMNATADSNPQPGVDTSLPAPAPTPTPMQPTTVRPAPPTTASPSTSRPTTASPTTASPTTPRPRTTGSAAPRPTAAPATTAAPRTNAPSTPTPTTAAVPAPATPGTSTAGAGTTDSSRPTGPTGPAGPGATTEAPGSTAATDGSASSGPVTTTRPVSETVTRSRNSTGGALTSRAASPSGPADLSAPAGGTPILSPAATRSSVVPSYTDAADPDLAAAQVEPGSSSPWPVIAVLALALIAGGTAVVIARRRRGDGI
ncbi:MAG: hypothetical protein WKF57_16740 [Nakamurella sp.]